LIVEASQDLVLIENVFVHYPLETQQQARTHINQKLREGGVCVEGFLDPVWGHALIHQKQNGRLIPKEIFFVNHRQLATYLDVEEKHVHPPLNLTSQQQQRMRQVLGLIKKLPGEGKIAGGEISEKVVRYLNNAGFVATMAENGRSFTMALDPDMSPVTNKNGNGKRQQETLEGHMKDADLKGVSI
jgi:hypothetical protein